MVTVYGADWCEDTQRSLRHLRRLGVGYRYENVDEDEAALERAVALNDGKRRTPTIDIEGTTLVEPTNAQLDMALEERGVVTREQIERQLRLHNVGDLERGLRIGGGLLAVGLALRMRSPWKWAIAAWGAFEAVSGAAGSCPVYRALGMTSVAGPADHPTEAERTAWLAPAVRPAAVRALAAQE